MNHIVLGVVAIATVSFLIGIAAGRNVEKEESGTFHRGDKVELLKDADRQSAYYDHCESTFIASQATERGNVALVLVKNCFYQVEYNVEGKFENPDVVTWPLANLRKLK